MPKSYTLAEIVVSLIILSVIAVSGGSMLLSSNRASTRLVGTLDAKQQAQWAVQRMVEEIQQYARNTAGVSTINPGNSAFGVPVKLSFQRDADGNGTMDRVWYWIGRGDPSVPTDPLLLQYGRNDSLYRGVDFTEEGNVNTSFTEAVNESRRQPFITGQVTANPAVNPLVPAVRYPVFTAVAGANTVRIILTVNPVPDTASSAYNPDNNATIDTLAYVR